MKERKKVKEDERLLGKLEWDLMKQEPLGMGNHYSIIISEVKKHACYL